jgi:hypothetical protein
VRLKDLRIGDKVWDVINKGQWIECSECKMRKWIPTGYRVSVGRVFQITFFNGELRINEFCGTHAVYADKESAYKDCAKLNRRFARKGY